jgi:hypothetical protein
MLTMEPEAAKCFAENIAQTAWHAVAHKPGTDDEPPDECDECDE